MFVDVFLGANLTEVYRSCSDLVDPLKKVQDLNENIFSGLDPFDLQLQAQDLILQVHTRALQLKIIVL